MPYINLNTASKTYQRIRKIHNAAELAHIVKCIFNDLPQQERWELVRLLRNTGFLDLPSSFLQSSVESTKRQVARESVAGQQSPKVVNHVHPSFSQPRGPDSLPTLNEGDVCPHCKKANMQVLKKIAAILYCDACKFIAREAGEKRKQGDGE